MGACDYCIRERARWYCAADDAFLCQTCDSWVHSASLLAGRHRRVHLNPQEALAPSWNHPRKPRSTPRYPAKHKEEPPLVPEICADGDDDDDHNDHQQLLLYRVPTLQQDDEESFDLDMRLLWEGVKVEEDDHELPMLANHHHQNQSFDTATGLKFDYGEKVKTEESSAAANEEESGSTRIVPHKKKTTVLNLDYEGVISAWSDERSPWTTGQRPELNSDEIWPDSMAMGMTTIGQGGGREARVLRYREKRRRRMFCKKIRYEVRKLNAEKRPRMKGRFVKRTTNFPAPLALLNNQ